MRAAPAGRHSAPIPHYASMAGRARDGSRHDMTARFHPAWLLGLGILMATPAAARQSRATAATLDQAVILVQQESGGKVLSAEQRHVGRQLEYRVKVLTPDGHVRVVTVDAASAREPSAASSTKNPAGHGGGNKEKH